MTAEGHMEGERVAYQIRLSHKGHCYCVALIDRLDNRWSWSYVLHDVRVAGPEEPVEDEDAAIAQAMRAATSYIDRFAE
jgi:hypothetical protein